MITVLTVDEALRHICAILREESDRGDITPAERDLLLDGAILLAMRVDDLDRKDRVSAAAGWPRGEPPESAGRHERHAAAAAA